MNVTNQGSYVLINSTVLNYYFQNYLNNQGVGINTFVYFSGIPWEDSPASNPYNPLGSSPLFADAVTISYVSGKPTIVASGYSNVGVCPGGVGPVEDKISVGGYTPLPVGYPFTMFEYGWNGANGCSAGVGCSSGYYVGILYNFVYCKPPARGQGGIPSYNTTYYYGGSGWSWVWNWFNSGWQLQYFFAYISPFGSSEESSESYIPFVPLDQQNNNNYLYYGIFYTYYWYTLQNGQINTYFLVNGNIYNNPLPKSNYQLCFCDASLFGYCIDTVCYYPQAILPEPPSTYITQSYQNAYETAFVAERNYALNSPNIRSISANNLPPGFIDGTFGYLESYGGIVINYLSSNVQYYQGQPYLFISAGSGGGSGYMYLDWVIATFGVPYEITVP